MQEQLMKLATELEMDFSFQLDNMYRRMRRLICFDMDSTLIETEVIDELAIRAGVGDQVKAITERAMRGEIDFIESFRERVALLKGLDESVMQEIAENLPITEGVDRLMYVLKKYGYKIAILSGGFTYFGQYLQKKYGIDYVYANELEIEDGKLTGRYLGDVVDGKRKAELLCLIAQVEKVDIAQTQIWKKKCWRKSTNSASDRRALAEKPQPSASISRQCRLILRECRVQSTSTAMLPVIKRR